MTAAVAPSEAEFQAQVVDLFRLCGWEVLHVRRSIGRRGGGRAWQTTTSIKGWPDLLVWHPGAGLGPVAVELKSETGALRPEQREVLRGLAACGVRGHVWRPSDWAEVEALARQGRQAVAR